MTADLAADLTMALDPARLFQATIGDAPDPWQARLLRSSASRVLLNCSRQSGKSTTTAVLGLHTALYEPGALVLLLAPALRQAQELHRKIKASYAALGRPERLREVEAETALRLEFASGGRIVCLPGREATIRGFSAVSLILIDEAARVPDELYYSIRPMLAVSGGRLIALSSPFGRRGFFYGEWAGGGDVWERYEVPATDCPRISAAFLAEERRSLGDWWYSQEYKCEFRDTVDQVFSTADIDAAVSARITALEW
jgi:hypothetical protein